MNFDFTGKRVLVAGGSRGIGRSIALGFAKAGAKVSACARGAADLAALQAEGVAHVKPTDLADVAQIGAWVAEAAASFGGVDVLVNNASGFGAPDTEEAWKRGLDIDVMAIVRATHAALDHLKASRGCVVNTTSISGYAPSTRSPAYAAVKALVINYTASQAAMYAKDGIRVNAVAPGSIEFPGGSWEKRKTDDPTLYNRILAGIPFGRLGEPEEVADVAMFLASPLARWVTGQTIVVDGGQMLT
ncbi:SDR family oxidoreductase [Roseomonas sp. HJA6]|uniref:SDR family oxidoreductase n=1 Tax=Roseomonas alba TaxID=2846776 RepID=A0ABS7AEJ7_9PROT|nr:SDR family NAD(P)-dependent oxidoreductase [Neoroseomonas alba]MBW6400731.1 SDR family oxidoreductase [Neoroseomonas alba]